MTASLNRVMLMGCLGADPERRSMTGGGDVVSFSIATSERWNDRDGNRKESTQWHRVVIFNEVLGKVAMDYLRKGSSCYVEGQQQTRKYKAQDQTERSVTEVVLQKFRGELKLLDRGQADAAERPPVDRSEAAREPAPLDDNVPF